ncbi:chromosome partitioning protein [Micromonospora sp. NPDC023956]|uniref:MinD/ParA family ATP-binding protein n=1 Tax=Micromonospora sp. NPDC023956 TaxID=3155722 RepID=UPI0033E9A166
MSPDPPVVHGTVAPTATAGGPTATAGGPTATAAPQPVTDDSAPRAARPSGTTRSQADSPWALPPQRSTGAPVAVHPPVPRQQQVEGDSVPGWYSLPSPPVSGGPLPPGSASARADDAPPTDGGGAAAGDGGPYEALPPSTGRPATGFGPEPQLSGAPPNLPTDVHHFDGGPHRGGPAPGPGDTTWPDGQAGPPVEAYPGNPTPAPAGGASPSGWAPLPTAPATPGWPASGGWATAAQGPTAPSPSVGQQYPAPGQPGGVPAELSSRVPTAPGSYSEPLWSDGATPTAEDFARRRQARPADPVATMGVRAVVNRTSLGLVKLPPGRHEQEVKHDIEMVRRNFGGLRQVTVVNPKGGAGKTVAILLLAMTFGQKRGGYVLAWDNNETQGTLGMRAQQDFHSRTVRDMLRDLAQFQGAHGRVGDLSQYVRSQGEGMFDVLASDESATGGEMLTASAFAEIRDVVSRFYKLIFVDTGNNVRAQNWQAAMDATDQLVVTMSARNDSAETAARMLDHLEQSGRQRLVRQAVTVVSMPPSRKEIDLPAIQEHFSARTRAVLLAPYERLIDTGEPIRYGQLSSATRDAWLKIAAAVAEGL